MSWDDCLEAIRCGASLNDIFGDDASRSQNRETLSINGSIQRGDGDSGTDSHGIPSTFRLYHHCDEIPSHIFQFVYLRPPFALWDQTEFLSRQDCLKHHANGDEGEASEYFDGELEFDVLGMFQQRFIDLPEVLTSLGDKSANEPVMSSSEFCLESFAVPDDALGDSTQEAFTERRSRILASLKGALMEDSLLYLHQISRDLLNLSSEQWSDIISELSSGISVNPDGYLRLLRAIRSCSLAEFILLAVVPQYIQGLSEDSRFSDSVTELVQLAAECCSIGDWNCARFRDELRSGVFGTPEDTELTLRMLDACLAFCK